MHHEREQQRCELEGASTVVLGRRPWIDPGTVHEADSENSAFARVTSLGIPDRKPATERVEPFDC